MFLVSVITPAFRLQGFEAPARSMASNADVDVEWIVANDASYDAVFATLPEGVQLIRQRQKLCQGAARNAGLVRELSQDRQSQR